MLPYKSNFSRLFYNCRNKNNMIVESTMRFIFVHFVPSGAHNKMKEIENFASFPCKDMLSRCFHFGFLKFLFPVCFFWLFWLSGSVDYQYFTFNQKILKKIMMFFGACVFLIDADYALHLFLAI